MEQEVGTNQSHLHLSFSSNGKGVEIEARGSIEFLCGMVELIDKLFSSSFIEKQAQKEE